MEKAHPVCVLGVSDPTGVISAEKSGIRNIYINWGTSFPKETVEAIRASGAIPMITWEPYVEDIKSAAILPAIAAGTYDVYIATFAEAAGDGKMFIRFAHEPNSDWYGWSGVHGGAGLYIQAFRRVRKIFTDQKAANAKFIFSVNAEDVPLKKWNRFENYYPGDEYADIIGIDAFNWGSSRGNGEIWKMPAEVIADAYDRAIEAFPSKPLFITETASCSRGGNKNRWIRRLLGSVRGSFPAVKAIVWFNMDKEADWALSSEETRKQYYGACGTGEIECSAKSLEWVFTGKKAEE